MSDMKKRNRSGNFDQEDTELFLALVNENKALLESGKQEDKKKGWDAIHETFNEHCSGIKRDVNALKMKLKNSKAQTKKIKLGDNQDEEQTECEGEESEQKKNLKKRAKAFTSAEANFLQELYDKHCIGLDTSLSRDALEQRQKAWKTVAEEFNNSQVSEIQRDVLELKMKFKNLKSQRFTFKSERDSRTVTSNSIVEEEHIDSPADTSSRVAGSSTLNSKPAIRTTRPKKAVSYSKSHYNVLDELDPAWDDSDDDYPLSKAPTTNDTENDVIRKENLLLKNSVLRKKERLLELQIAIAERTLRRHQI